MPKKPQTIPSNKSETTPQDKKWTESKDHRIIYANIFQTRASDNDFALVLGIDGDEAAVGQVTVMMTTRTAKVLAHSLSEFISRFEATKGPISMPEGTLENITKKLDSAFSKLTN